MPGILFRHIFVDLVKVLVVTTSVLVVVIAFGAAIKPISENLLGPADILKYMMYATVPMLQYALPFSAAFAGVIVYHRLTADNEILAMAACGIPYRRILRPAVVLGIGLTIFMVVLVDIGVPTFWWAIKQLLARDITRGFVAYVERGEAVPFGSSEIYADEAHVEEAPADSGAAQRLLLVGVAAFEFVSPAERSSIEPHQPLREFTAQYATIDVHRIGYNAFLKATLQNSTVFTRGDRAIAGAAVVRPEAIDLGQTVQQGPKGLSFVELLALRRDLTRDPDVAALRDALRSAIASADVWQSVGDEARSGKPIAFAASRDRDASHYEVRGARLVRDTLLPSGAPPSGTSLEIRQIGSDGSVRGQFTAPSALLTLVAVDPVRGARFDLLADEASARDPRSVSGALGVPRTLRLPELTFIDARADNSNASIDELKAIALTKAATVSDGPVEALHDLLTGAVGNLETRVNKVSNEIVARIVQRGAQSMTAILMLLSGSILAVWLRHRPPLFVYVIAFVPAIIDILLVSSGEQILRTNASALGVAVSFSGNVVLVLVCLVGAWRVRQH
ncbi:MAG: LptF/LptG family permease [Phycisphaerae bacterium]|nr:LptF/LptG family permease [Phycisphaerae bacterium]